HAARRRPKGSVPRDDPIPVPAGRLVQRRAARRLDLHDPSCLHEDTVHRPGSSQRLRQYAGARPPPVHALPLSVRSDVAAAHRGRDRSNGDRQAARAGRDPARRRGRLMAPSAYLILGAILFSVGTLGVLLRRNALVIFMSIELMLNAVNLTLVTFARMRGTLDGQVLAFFVIAVAAAEVVVGLAIIVAMFRRKQSAAVEDARLFSWQRQSRPLYEAHVWA